MPDDAGIRTVDETGKRPGRRFSGVGRILAGAICYYVATRVAWLLCFPDSKVSLFFPPHAVLVSILLLAPTRHWWAYVLAAGGAHLIATQQVGWPLPHALHCEAFDAVKSVATAAGIRMFVRSSVNALTLRDATLFVLIAVVLVPFGSAFWGAGLAIYHGFGVSYWIEGRNLAVSNAVTTVVLVPALLLAAHHLFVGRPRALLSRRALEATLLIMGMVVVGEFVFDRTPAGPKTSPALLYTPIPLLIWAALRFGLGGISIAMLVITFQAIWGTMHGHGPFFTQTPAENALALQLFLMVTATPLMLLAVVIDEERRSKEALSESRNLMGLAADSAGLAMWVWDVPNLSGWITERGRALYGLGPEALFDCAAVLDRVHPEDRAARDQVIKGAIEARGEYEIEFRVRQPDGAVRWINSRGRCVETGGGAGPKLLGILMDVTARKEAEASAARERESLAHLSRVALLGEMAASLAHELSQPLAAMSTNARAGRRFLNHDGVDLQEVGEIFDDIAADGRRAADVIRGIKDMVRKSEGRKDVVAVNALVTDVVRLASPDAYARGCVLKSDLDPTSPTVIGDPVQLKQVLLNLVINAFDAMSHSPQNECRVEVASRLGENRTVELSVRDRGAGLPSEGPSRVFDRFFTTKCDGMGMGLAIARSIVEAHGGSLQAENAEGGGARFWLRMPIHEPCPGAPSGVS